MMAFYKEHFMIMTDSDEFGYEREPMENGWFL